VTRRARARPGEDQLSVDLDAAQHQAVEAAREVRAGAGLPEPLTAPDVLALVRTVLDVDRASTVVEVTRSTGGRAGQIGRLRHSIHRQML